MAALTIASLFQSVLFSILFQINTEYHTHSQWQPVYVAEILPKIITNIRTYLDWSYWPIMNGRDQFTIVKCPMIIQWYLNCKKQEGLFFLSCHHSYCQLYKHTLYSVITSTKSQFTKGIEDEKLKLKFVSICYEKDWWLYSF